jgi:cytochrome P450
MKSLISAWVQRHLLVIFTVLRNTVPIVTFRGKFALVTRAADVREVLSNDDAFMVTYEPKMRVVAGGENFFLGMGDTEQYHRDAGNWRAVFPAGDAETIVAPLVEEVAAEIVGGCGGELDAIVDLGGIVPCAMVERYMGVTGPTRPELVDWTTHLFGYLFYPADPGPADDAAARVASSARDHIDFLIAERKSSGEQRDDGIGRALAMQAAGVEAMSDEDIRNNLLGIVIGAVPTTSKCVGLVLDHLLDHPDRMAGAQQAARAGAWDLLNGFVDECLRFNPFGPVLLRECRRDHRLAAGSLRARTIKQGATVAVGTLSAMWDGREVDDRTEFDVTRPASVYLTYGDGMHTCFGARINAVQIARIVGAVLAAGSVARATGGVGSLEMEGQFPAHLRLTITE